MKSGDPLNINSRLYGQIGKLLDDLEADDRDDKMTTPQRISALIAVGRILTIFAALKKQDYDYGNTGSAVRKYAAAFARPDQLVGERTLPDQPSLSNLIATAAAATSSTRKAVSAEYVHRGAWKAGGLGSINVLAIVLAVRLGLLVAIVGVICLTYIAIQAPDPLRPGGAGDLLRLRPPADDLARLPPLAASGTPSNPVSSTSKGACGPSTLPTPRRIVRRGSAHEFLPRLLHPLALLS